MTTNEKAMKELEKLAFYYGNDIEDWEIGKYLKQQEQFAKDVARYFELWEQGKSKCGNGIDDIEAYEFTKLHIKLSNVGKEE